MSGPSIFEWTLHARVKAGREALVPTDIEGAVAEHHDERRRNPREADWLLTVRRLVVAYNWPLEGDRTRARIISVWRLPR